MYRLVLSSSVLLTLQMSFALLLVIGCVSPKKSEHGRSANANETSTNSREEAPEARTYFVELQGKDRKLIDRIKPHLFSKLGSRACFKSQDVAPEMQPQPDCHAFREATPKTILKGLPSADGSSLLYRVSLSEIQPGTFQYEVQGFQNASTGKLTSKPQRYYTPGTFAAPSVNQKSRGKIRLSVEEAAEQIGFTIIALSFRRDE